VVDSKKFVVIGDGIASKLLSFALYQEYQQPITVIASDEFAPACSTRTTAINCLRGTRKGLSPLGDSIVDTYEEFVAFYNEHKPAGLDKTVELQLWQDNREKWLRRFGSSEQYETLPFFKNMLDEVYEGFQSEAYIFHPESFFSWLDGQFEKEFIQDYVTAIQKENGYRISTQKERFCKQSSYSFARVMSYHFFNILLLKKKLKDNCFIPNLWPGPIYNFLWKNLI
jgi:hypothetical protein